MSVIKYKWPGAGGRVKRHLESGLPSHEVGQIKIASSMKKSNTDYDALFVCFECFMDFRVHQHNSGHIAPNVHFESVTYM